MTTENIENAVNVTLTNDRDLIVDQIASIKTNAGRYKANVSSALINAVAHHINNGGFELITSLIEQVAAANPRDLKVVSLFIEKVTPFVLEKDESKLTRIGKSKVFVPSVIGRIKATAKAGDADDQKKKDNADQNGVKRFKQFAGTLTDTKGNNLPRGYNLGKDNGGIVDYSCDVFAWADYQEYQKKTGGDGKKGKTDEQKRVDVADRQVNSIDTFIDLDWIKGDTEIEAAAVVLKNLILAKVKVDREKLDTAAKAAQLVKQLDKLAKGDFKDRTDDWKAHHAKLCGENKTLENIDAAYKQWVEGMEEKAKAAKEAESAKGEEKPEVITSENQ